jgi:hypothetical protein
MFLRSLESDVDLFIISRKAKKQSGLFMERHGIVFHGNVISPKEMRERVRQGTYFGKSLIGKLSADEVRKLKKLQSQSLKSQIQMLEREASPWLAQYLPLWVDKVRAQKRAMSFEELNEKLVIDAYHVYVEARARGLLDFEEASRSFHGFKVPQWVVSTKARRRSSAVSARELGNPTGISG